VGVGLQCGVGGGRRRHFGLERYWSSWSHGPPSGWDFDLPGPTDPWLLWEVDIGQCISRQKVGCLKGRTTSVEKSVVARGFLLSWSLWDWWVLSPSTPCGASTLDLCGPKLTHKSRRNRKSEESYDMMKIKSAVKKGIFPDSCRDKHYKNSENELVQSCPKWLSLWLGTRLLTRCIFQNLQVQRQIGLCVRKSSLVVGLASIMRSLLAVICEWRYSMHYTHPNFTGIKCTHGFAFCIFTLPYTLEVVCVHPFLILPLNKQLQSNLLLEHS
jgi:hypothetical protein